MDEHDRSLTDGKWRALSTAGNEAFHRGDDVTARALYALALDEALQILSLAKSGHTTAMAIAPVLHTIACHNLAELERRAGRPENDARSSYLLGRALELLVDLARDDSLPIALRASSVDNLKHALTELVEHSSEKSADALASVTVRVMEAWSSIRALESSLQIPEASQVRRARLAS